MLDLQGGSMGLLDGKKALIFGVANDHSIAWGIARALHDQGAVIGFSSVESLIEKRVRPLATSIGSTLVELVREARPLLHTGSSVLTLTYYGAEKVVGNYNVMGVAKAALEASVRYLAADLGPDGIRVNAISAGPIRTLAASGIAGFKKMYGAFADIAPLRANITIEDVGKTAVYLASDLSSAVTGEVVYVDGGFNILGVPTTE